MNRLRSVSSHPYALLGIVLWGLALRIGCAQLITRHDPIGPDTQIYREVGRRFWNTLEITGLYFHMPLYPIVTGLLGSIGTTVFDISISIVTVILVYVLAIQIWQDRLAALFASFFAASYPLFVFYSTVGLSDTLYVTLSVAPFVCWYAEQFLAAALFSVLAILTRPLFAGIAPVMIVCFSLIVFRQPLRAAVKHVLVYATIYCALMVPWWVNNYAVYGKFVPLIPMSAAVLYIGNNPMNKTGSQTVDVDFEWARIHVKSSEVLNTNQELESEAIAFIRNHPATFLELAVKKALILWRPWPIAGPYSSGIYFWSDFLTSGPIIFLAIFGVRLLAKDDPRKGSPIFLYLAMNTGIVMVLASLTRYRMPLEPFLFVLAAMPFAVFMRWVGKCWLEFRDVSTTPIN